MTRREVHKVLDQLAYIAAFGAWLDGISVRAWLTDHVSAWLDGISVRAWLTDHVHEKDEELVNELVRRVRPSSRARGCTELDRSKWLRRCGPPSPSLPCSGGVYKLTPEGLELVPGIGRTRVEAIQAAARQLGFPP